MNKKKALGIRLQNLRKNRQLIINVILNPIGVKNLSSFSGF